MYASRVRLVNASDKKNAYIGCINGRMGIIRRAFMQQQVTVHDNKNQHPVATYRPNYEVPELTEGEKILKYSVMGVGVSCTLLALFGVIRSSLRGERHAVQKFMRYRVTAQFLTVSGVGLCLMYFALKRRKNR
uniref:HIG1 domain-containing protein n=1 Tax=Syphacia muris TaxID=451379 RepID=A0A0N5A9P8_9BILA